MAKDINKTFTNILSGTAHFLKRRYDLILVLTFFAMVGAWVHIFWVFGYAVAFRESEVPAHSLSVKQKQLYYINYTIL